MQEVSLFLSSFKDYASIFQGFSLSYGIALFLFFGFLIWIMRNQKTKNTMHGPCSDYHGPLTAAALTGIILKLIRWPDTEKELFYSFLHNEGLKTATQLFEYTREGVSFSLDPVQSRSKQGSALAAILNRYIKECFGSHEKWIDHLWKLSEESSHDQDALFFYPVSDKDLLVQVTEDQILWIEDLLESKSQNGGKVWNYRLERLYDTVHGKYLHLVDPKAETEGNGKFKFEALVSVIPEL